MESRFFPVGTFAPLDLQPVPAEEVFEAEVVAPLKDGFAALHNPPLQPRDEAVFLLTAVAEIEHALMVQYLFAAYSIKVPDPVGDEPTLHDRLVQIAREEMSHLITVQNLLHLVGGPLNLGRDRAPYGSEIYPFRFTLEPVTLGSLAKYVTAESPIERPAGISDADWALVATIAADAEVANGGPINHVGALFARLEVLFGDGPDGMADADFRTDTAGVQAKWDDWGFDARRSNEPAAGARLIVDSFDGQDVAALRAAALTALKGIADQGEGYDLTTPGESHFERFFAIYKLVSDLVGQRVEVAWSIATNPNTSPRPEPAPGAADPVDMAAEAVAAAGRITEPRAKAWAQLFNLRYRMLLGRLAHFLRLDQEELYVSVDGPQQGDRTARGLLLLGAFDEMRHLKKIAAKLVRMPKDAGGTLHAGPPFELPYSLSLPDGEAARWRMHLDVSRAAVALVDSDDLKGDPDPFLAVLKDRDQKAQEAMTALAAGATIPASSLPTGFAKAVTILDEAVRGFPIDKAHKSFWSGKTRDDFVNANVMGSPPVALDEQGAVVPDPAKARLIQRITHVNPHPDQPDTQRMPRYRPPVPPARVAYLKQWILEGALDDTPAGKKGVETEPEPDLSVAPAGPPGPVVGPPAGVPGFAADIAPLFRDIDRLSMMDSFDLASVDDVRAHAQDILDAVATEFMPCDGPWPAERVALLRRWVEGGMLP